MAGALFHEPGARVRRFKPDDELDITPMIDMTFLLLIFFMVTSTMQPPSALDLPPAKHGLGVSNRESTILTIFMSDEGPEIYLADGKRERGPATLSEVIDYVAAGVQQQHSDIIIKADRETPSGFVEEVARAANEVDGVKSFYVGVQDKPSS